MIVARYLNMRVLALSLVTNVVIHSPYQSAAAAVEEEEHGRHDSALTDPPPTPAPEPARGGAASSSAEVFATHDEVLETGRRKADDMIALVTRVVQQL